MKTPTTYWDKRKLERYLKAEEIGEEYQDKIKSIYQQAYKNINSELLSVYENYSKETGLDIQSLKQILTKSETKKTFEELRKKGLDKYVMNNYKARITRLEQIQAQIYAKAKEIYPSEAQLQKECFSNVIRDGYYRTIYDVERGTGHIFQFSQINDNTISTLLNDNWSGKNYSQRIWGNTDILAENLQEIIGAGLLTGQSYPKLSRQLRERINVAKYYSDRLIRTETNYFNNQIDAIANQELGFDEYVVVATLDNKTSPYCIEIDQKKYKYSEMEVGDNYPPFHPNCRCTVRAYLGEFEKEIKRTAINPTTGERDSIDNIPYKEWIKKYATTNRAEQQPVKNTDKVPKNNKKQSTTGIVDNINDKIDSQLHKVTVDRLNELNNKYPSMDKFFKEKGTTIDNKLLGFSTNAQVEYDYNISRVNFSVNNFRYKDYNELVDKVTDNVKSNWNMPCNKKYYDVYTITHEYGHAIECKLINDYNLSHPEELAKVTEKLEKYKTGNYDTKYAIAQTQNITRKYTNHIVHDIAQDILKIAHDIDPEFELTNYISRYGKTNSYEFFAECFANSECGSPNTLGKAMTQYLKERGI